MVSELLGPQCSDQHSPTRWLNNRCKLNLKAIFKIYFKNISFHSHRRRRLHPRQAVEEGNARRMERRGKFFLVSLLLHYLSKDFLGSSFLGEVPAPAVGGSDKLGTIMSNQTQSKGGYGERGKTLQLFVGSLACLGTTTSIAAAAAITKASAQDPVREGSARSNGAYTYNAMSILIDSCFFL